MNIQEITQLLINEGCDGVTVTDNTNGIYQAMMPDGYFIQFRSCKMPMLKDRVSQVARRILTK